MTACHALRRDTVDTGKITGDLVRISGQGMGWLGGGNLVIGRLTWWGSCIFGFLLCCTLFLTPSRRHLLGPNQEPENSRPDYLKSLGVPQARYGPIKSGLVRSGIGL